MEWIYHKMLVTKIYTNVHDDFFKAVINWLLYLVARHLWLIETEQDRTDTLRVEWCW